jgi:hypothetical protein
MDLKVPSKLAKDLFSYTFVKVVYLIWSFFIDGFYSVH